MGEVPDLVLGKALGLWMNTKFLVEGQKRCAGGVPPGRACADTRPPYGLVERYKRISYGQSCPGAPGSPAGRHADRWGAQEPHRLNLFLVDGDESHVCGLIDVGGHGACKLKRLGAMWTACERQHFVTRAFAVRGISLEQKAPLMAARGTNGLAKLFWNRTAASSQGVITVQVLRTAADAKSFPAPILKLNPVRDSRRAT